MKEEYINKKNFLKEISTLNYQFSFFTDGGIYVDINDFLKVLNNIKTIEIDRED